MDKEIKVIFLNNTEFRSLPDHLSRVNLLISEGIETNVTNGKYDFSHIKNIHHKSASTSDDENSSSDEEAALKDASKLPIDDIVID